MKKPAALLLVIYLAGVFIAVGQTPPVQFPKTEKIPVTDEYHGVTVVDDYRWLENANDLRVKDWVSRQNASSASVLDASPLRTGIRERLDGLYRGRSAIHYN